MTRRSTSLRAAAALLALPLLASAAVAQAPAPAYPARPAKIVLAFGPGGSADVIARVVAAKISETWPHALIVENKPGADGDLAGEAVARAAPDGHTMLVTSQALAVNVSLRPKRPYKVDELAPVMLIADTQTALVVPTDFEARDVKHLIALAKASPGALDFGSTGVGTSGHMAMELFKLTAGIDIVHIPFRNTGQWYTDMVGGRIKMGMPTIPGITPHVRSGRLRALGVSGAKRSAALPDAPTIAEAALPGFEATTWYPLLVPKGTPAAIIQAINAAFRTAMEDPVVKSRLLDSGVDIVASTPAALEAHITTEIDRWAKVVKEAKITTE